MPIFDIFSKKQKKLRGEVIDVYQYKTIPDTLRVQISRILDDSFGQAKTFYGSIPRNEPEEIFQFINDTLSREYGLFSLLKNYGTHREVVMNFLLKENDTEKVIDVVQLSFQYI